jgi:hypothetical protein
MLFFLFLHYHQKTLSSVYDTEEFFNHFLIGNVITFINPFDLSQAKMFVNFNNGFFVITGKIRSAAYKKAILFTESYSG